MYEVLDTDVNINPNKVSWVTLLKNLLSTLGFYQVWLAQSAGNVDVFIHVFKQRLSDVNIQNWNSRIENSPSSTFYKIIVSFDLQFYLKCDLPCHFRVAMSKLLLSSHNLLIETGSWHRPHSIPREDRTCNICNKLEDEHHFIIECSLNTKIIYYNYVVVNTET